MSKIIPECEELSIEEIDEKLDEAVARHEISECQICFLLFEMQKRRGFEDFGFGTILDYAHQRFGYIPRKTYYMLSLVRKLENLPQITKAFEEGKLRWFKAHRIASVAKPEDEVMWLESALSMAVKDLDRKIRNEVGVTYTKLRFCLSEDQAAVVEYALEVCRKVSGAELSPEQCLEYMAAEFLATYAQVANKEEDASTEEAPETEASDPVEVEGDHSACPDNGDMPSPFHVRPSKVMLSVYERDGWACTYPGCSARSMLHDHHIDFRSRFGKKTIEERDSLTNRTTVCAFHHTQLHAGISGVKGKAPFELSWRKPTLYEAAEMRWERKARYRERRKARGYRREQRQAGGVKSLQKSEYSPCSDAEAETAARESSGAAHIGVEQAPAP